MSGPGFFVAMVAAGSMAIAVNLAAMPNPSAPPTQGRSLTVQEWEQQHRNLGYENAAIFDQGGQMITSMKGTQRQVSPNGKQRKQSQGNLFVHNHPAINGIDSSFSRADWQYAATYQVAEMRVVSPWSRYRLSCPWSAQWWQAKGGPTFDRASAQLKPQYLAWGEQLAQQGYSTPDINRILNTELMHAVNAQAAQELGCAYSKEVLP